MRRQKSVNVIMYIPKTEAGRLELAMRVADVHADAVNRRLKDLKCPASQKLGLLDAVIRIARAKPPAEQDPQKKREQTKPAVTA